jgi:hypothetical protein
VCNFRPDADTSKLPEESRWVVCVTDASHYDRAVYLTILLSFLLPTLDYVLVRGTKRKCCYLTDEFLSVTTPEAQQRDRLAVFFIAHSFVL